MDTFKNLGLSTEIQQAITELGFEKPSKIQQKAIPQLITEDRDFIGLAQTGTGKTAAFGLPILERIDTTDDFTQALILAPTRELGQQIAEQLKTFSKYQQKVNVLAVYGGASIVTQMKALKKTQHVIIATPGRLIDLIKRKAIRLDQLKFLVLDEADEMLNMGFKDELDKILSYTPEEKLTWLFSATMSKEIKRIVKQYMDNPLEVRIDAQDKVNVNIEHQFILVKEHNKTEALIRFLNLDSSTRAVVFCRTKNDTQNLADKLMKKNYQAGAIHGDLSQAQRDKVMRHFKTQTLQVLIATDVAARGIDVNDLTHVFHFALPDDVAYYTHRSGRTARAGKKGISLAFITPSQKSKLDRFARQLKIQFSQVAVPSSEDIYESKVEHWCQSVLEKSARDTSKNELLEKAKLLFTNLSKEELIAKIIAFEFDKVDMDSHKDLNEKAQQQSQSKKRRERNSQQHKYKKNNQHKKRGRRSRRKKKTHFTS